MSEHKRPIDDVSEIPPNLSDEEMIDFLDEHGVSEAFLENTPEVPEEERPIPRTKPINIRFDDLTLRRLKEMADRRNVGYQTLLKMFVTERLYEEEKREGMLPTTPTGEAEETRPPSEPSEKQRTRKPRDWQKEAHAFVDGNKELLEDPDIDSITLSRLTKNSTDRLLEISEEIKKSSARAGFPATQLRRMKKGYDKLLEFSQKALTLYEEKFGQEELAGEQSDDTESAIYRSVIEEAERILQEP
jgi:predicted DNA binding CopG/RHH family protein